MDFVVDDTVVVDFTVGVAILNATVFEVKLHLIGGEPRRVSITSNKPYALVSMLLIGVVDRWHPPAYVVYG